MLSLRKRASLPCALGVFFAFSIFGFGSCSVFDPPPATNTDGGAGTAGTAGSGGTTSGPWWPHVNSHNCQSAGVPGGPETDGPATEEPGASLPPIYLALSKYRMSTLDDGKFTEDPTSTAWQDIGLDLDDACKNSDTCQVNGENVQDKICEPHTTLAGTKDGKQCRDNTIGRLFFLASNSNPGSFFGMREADWNCEILRGRMSIIFKISDYNGKQNDKQVRLDMYVSTGLVEPSTGLLFACRSKLDENGLAIEEGIKYETMPNNWWKRAFPPASKRWKVTAESIAPTADEPETDDLPDSKWNDPTAYVRNGYIVAHLPDQTEFWLNGKNATIPGFRLIVQRPVLVGKLASGPWTLKEAVMSGAIDPNRMIQSFNEFGFCKNMCASYDLVVSTLTDYRDTMLRSGAAAPGVKCDALSWATDIEAQQASARKQDIEAPVGDPVICPEPRNPLVPRQGQADCQLDGGTDAGTDSGSGS